jgi:hypothetical protein
VGSPNTNNTPGATLLDHGSASTPSTVASEGTHGTPLRFRTLTDLFDLTDEVQDFEYSGICMLAADEPVSVEQAIEEDCREGLCKMRWILSTRT